MLYVYTGNDPIRVRQEAHEFLETCIENGTDVRRVDAEECSEALLRDLAGAVSLFGGKEVILLDMPSESKDALDMISENAALLAESNNTFVLIDRKLLVAESKKIKKHAHAFHELTSGAKAERFNTFLMTDALLRRDKKSLWMLLLRARKVGISAEEVIGVLFWQIKVMRLADMTKNASEAGLKPFVYTKAKKGADVFGTDRITELSRDLLRVYHDGHLGKRDIDLALERFVLTV